LAEHDAVEFYFVQTLGSFPRSPLMTAYDARLPVAFVSVLICFFLFFLRVGNGRERKTANLNKECSHHFTFWGYI
jgi:hypothetical protein